MLYNVLVVVDALLAGAVIILILVNRGRGAEVGAAFGGGGASSASLFGSKGATPFITKVIAVLAGLFLANSLGLAYLANFQYVQRSVVDEVGIETLQQPEEQATDDVPDEFEDTGDTANDFAPDVPN